MLARLLEDADAGLAALGDEPFEAGVVALAGDEHVVKAALAGLESFFHRMQAVENFHGDSLVRAQRSAKNGDLEAARRRGHRRVLSRQGKIAARGERDIGSVICSELTPLPNSDQRSDIVGKVVGFHERQQGGNVVQCLGNFTAQDLPPRRHEQRVRNLQVPMNRNYRPRSADHKALDMQGICGRRIVD